MTARSTRREQTRQEQQGPSRQVCIHIPADALRNPQGGLISITLVIDPAQRDHHQVPDNEQQGAAGELHPALAPCYQLTPRELDVLKLVAIGLDNFDIAKRLGLARNTISNYMRILYEKLGVTSRTAATIWARERGLIADQHTTEDPSVAQEGPR